MQLKIQKLTPTAKIPRYMSKHASCVDLYSDEAVTIEPGSRALVGTGIKLEIPEGYEGQVISRSGIAINDGVFVLNAPGIIDSDYRGEIKIILQNLGEKPFEIRKGDRIAQLAIKKVEKIEFEIVEKVGNTARGAGGFGSTGKNG